MGSARQSGSERAQNKGVRPENDSFVKTTKAELAPGLRFREPL